MDFSVAEPHIDLIHNQFKDNGYLLCLVNTSTGHEKLNGGICRLPADMSRVARA